MRAHKNKVIDEDIKTIVNDLGDLAKQFDGKTILVSGGAGFLGKYLVHTLAYISKTVLERPCKIIVLDNFITGFRDAFEEWENIEIIEHDISKPIIIEENIDYILHAASIAAPMFYNKYRMETIDVGFLGTKNMLDLAKEKNVKSFMFFSTSEIYGNPTPDAIPTPETYLGNVSCTGPRAAYDEPKRIGETLCMNYGEMFNIPVKIVRPFNVYGPGMKLNDGRGAINFVVKALRGEKIPVYGTGRNTRSWCYITDAIVGFFQLLLSTYDKEAFNIGSDKQEIEMRHFAEIIAGLAGREENIEVELVEAPTKVYGRADVTRRFPDLTKAREQLRYKPKINLVPGLKRLIEWAEEAIQEHEAPTGEQTHCRICASEDLKKIISLGKSPLANSLLSEKDLEKKEELFPLEMMYCDSCNLSQLSYVVPPEKMFKDYLYVTSTTETFKKHFQEMAKSISDEFSLNKNSLVVDIGSNDGLLLKHFKDLGPTVVGVEPAENICEIARSNGVDTIEGFFDKAVSKEIARLKGKADVITANNVFAHVRNIKDLTRNAKGLLKDEGVFVIEVQYILDTLQQLTFDNIYHEHLSYFSVLSLNEFFKGQGMEVFKVQHVDSHGGSLRVFIQKPNGKHMMDPSVNQFLEKEKDFGLDKFETYEAFARKIEGIKEKVRDFTISAKGEGRKIVGYGAPAKATTMLNFYGINSSHIDYIIEDNPLKQGKTVPGVRIPIRKKDSEEATPDYIYILAWNFAEEILKNNEAYKEKGAKFVIPSPELKIV